MLSRRFAVAFLAFLIPSATAFTAPPTMKSSKPPRRLVQSEPVGADAMKTVAISDRAALLRSILGGSDLAALTTADRPSREEIAALAAVARSAKWREGEGTPRQLRVDALELSASAYRSEGDGSITVAREVLRKTRTLLGIENPDSEFVLRRVLADSFGTRVHFTQQYRGVPVWPSDLNIHLDRSGRPTLLDGAFARTPQRVRTVAVVTAFEARAIAATKAGAKSSQATEPQLIVFTSASRPPRLAWKIEVRKNHGDARSHIVDAQTGEVLESYNLVHSAKATGSGVDSLGIRRNLNVWQDGTTYFLVDASKGMYDATSTPPKVDSIRGGIIILDGRNVAVTASTPLYHHTTANSAAWTEPSAVSLSWGVSQAYEYYQQRHNRTSYDNNKATMLVIARYDRDLLNAFWNGVILAFGTGERFAASLDIVGHEMTHAVTDSTAALIYKDQSGALNEAMSDVFGEMIERFATGNNDWQIGTQLFNSAYRRNMIQPEAHGQPSKMSQFLVTTEDDGGVHTNSGIINKAFYTLASSIGSTDAERIFYRALSTHLVTRSDFLDARLAAVQSAKDIFGASSNQAVKAGDAFDAVEIFESAPPPPDPELPPVSAADSTLFVFNESAATYLGRRETSQGDPNIGVRIGTFQSVRSRPSVSGDGTVAFFNSAGRDACFLRTDGSQAEACVGVPGQVSSTAMSPDGSRYAFVFMNSSGNPTNKIRIIDIKKNTDRTFTLEVPVSDGESATDVAYADTMEFTSDGDFLIYDALAVTSFGDGTQRASWAIFAVDVNRGGVIPLYSVPGAADIEYPALSARSDRYMTFDVQTSTKSYVFLVDLETGDGRYIESDSYIGVPGYNGDDTAFIFSAAASTPSGRSIYRWGLGSDRMSAAGQPTLWVADADHGTIYRRGAFHGPTTEPGQLQMSTSSQAAEEGAVVTLFVDRVAGNKGAASVSFRTNNGTAVGGQDFLTYSGTLNWADADDEAKVIKVALLFDNNSEATESFSVVLSSPTGATLGSVTATNVTIENKAAPPPPTRRRPIRR